MRKFLHFTAADGWFGDPMPLWHDGIYHIYYTKRFPAPSDDERDVIGWGHISSPDLLHWTEHPDPFVHGTSDTPFNTGCVYYGKGRFHAFFAGRDESGGHIMLRAESTDGICFGKSTVALPAPPPPYRPASAFRDPVVVWDPDARLYRMLFCCRSLDSADGISVFSGIVAQALSTDLVHWEYSEPLSLTGVASSMECPDLFRDGERWILIYYWHETRFRHSTSINGPYSRAHVLSPDHFDFMAARQMYDGTHRYLIGWLPRRSCDCGERIWGGHMLYPRELTIDGDGNPQTRFARGLWDLFSVPYPLPEPKPDLSAGKSGAYQGWDGGYTLSAPNGGAMVWYPAMPEPYAMRFSFSLSSANGTLTLLIACGTAYGETSLDTGFLVLFDAAEGMVRLRRHYMWDQRPDIAVIPWHCTAGEECPVELIVDSGILELSVGSRETLVSRLLPYAPGGFGISVQDARATIADLAVYTLPEPK